jgi:hypothetical protein
MAGVDDPVQDEVLTARARLLLENGGSASRLTAFRWAGDSE